MSKYEWERGDIVIPTDQWVAFRRKIIEAHNREQERLFTLATTVLARVKLAAKGKRGFEWRRAIEESALALTTERRDWNDDGHAVLRLLGMTARHAGDGTGWVEGADKPRAPRRKDLDLRSVRGRAAPISADEGTISFIERSHTVRWSVSENNRACESARSHPVGRAFFQELGRVTWKRVSGGKIVGNDEYRRDSDEEGGGGNYVTAEYGPGISKPSRFSSLGFGGYR
jgi:hypothetical protein